DTNSVYSEGSTYGRFSRCKFEKLPDKKKPSTHIDLYLRTSRTSVTPTVRQINHRLLRRSIFVSDLLQIHSRSILPSLDFKDPNNLREFLSLPATTTQLPAFRLNRRAR